MLDNIDHTATHRTLKKYGFVPDNNLSVHLNARRALGSLHPSTYFPTVTKLAFHDLTPQNTLPKDAHLLLGLGLKFIPTPTLNITEDGIDRTLSRLERDIGLRVFFSDDQEETDYDPAELRRKSKWRAPLPPREIDARICRFQQELKNIFIRQKSKPNLSTDQLCILENLQNNKNVVVLSADKGLGPVSVTTEQYISWGLKHITDHETYSIISSEEAHMEANNLYQQIFRWTLQHRRDLEDNTIHYIRDHVEKARKDPFGYFYLLAKLHKTPVSTRPVCSDCASLPHSVGKWVDRQLQPIVQKQHTYFKNSFELKELLDTMELLPVNACLFTYDAVSMYTNIDTQQCIQRLTSFLMDTNTTTQFPHLKPHALIDALHLIMHNNRMRFGNLYIHQHKGIAMGMAPAPSIANLFVAIYEAAHIVTFPKTSLPFLRRFIDDGFGIWLRDSNQQRDTENWDTFTKLVNAMGLQWEFSPRSNKVTFMDLNIHLENGRLYTSLYAKPNALHLYIPPFSCHSPGITTGLINGHFFRLFMLCSHESDIEREIYLFFNRLVDRGYSLSNLIPLFLTAEQKARAQRSKMLQRRRSLQSCPPEETEMSTQVTPPRGDQTNTGVFLHLQYHPANPSANEIQRLWRRVVFTPPGQTPLYQLRNRDGYPININKLTVAYSRAPNLGNLLSCRKLRTRIDADTLHHSDTSMEAGSPSGN